MRKMPITDAVFLIAESRRTPMHVGGLTLYTLPQGVSDSEFLSQMHKQLCYDGNLRHPFGVKLKMGPLGPLGPVRWEDDHLLDMDYHIRHSALPQPGRYRELFSLVSRMHSTLLDRSRPLWELHLIEGLKNRQVATYIKTHHCALDGVGSIHLMNSMYSADKTYRLPYSPFSQEAYLDYKEKLHQHRTDISDSDARNVLTLLQDQFKSTVNIGRALQNHASVLLGRNDQLSVPFHHIPRTRLTNKISGARRFVAQSWSLPRIKAVGKAFGGTLNDAVLGMCSGALRRHLLANDDLPSQSLKAMAPVSLREQDDVDSGNAIGFLTADLATQVRAPEKRMQIIMDSMEAGKRQVRGMSQQETQLYTILTQAPMILAMLTGTGNRFPAFSTVISNVPGPRQRLYWNGARLDGMYPVSIPFDGFCLNITMVSHHDKLDFGIIACRRTVPQVQRLIDYLEDALVELEDAAGLGASKPKRRRATRKSAAPKKAATKKTPRRRKTTITKVRPKSKTKPV